MEPAYRPRFWLRAQTLIRGLLPLCPPRLVAMENLRRMVAFVKATNRRFPAMDLALWESVSRRMAIPLDVAHMYYAVFAELGRADGASVSALLEGSAIFPRGSLKRQPSSVEDVAPEVNVVEFALFLFLQRLSRNYDLNSSLDHDSFPSRGVLRERAHSTSALDGDNSFAASPHPSSTQISESARKANDFVCANLERILELLQLADENIKDYHVAPPSKPRVISAGALGPLDLLLEGAESRAQVDAAAVRPLALSALLRDPGLLRRHRLLEDGRLVISGLCRLIRGGLDEEDPFFLLSLLPLHSPSPRLSHRGPQIPLLPAPGRGGRSPAYIGVSASAPSHQIVFATNITKRAVVKHTNQLDGLHLMISNCESSQLYFPTSVSVMGVSGCRVVVGAVENVLRIHGARNTHIHAIARRLILSDCENVSLHVRTPTKPLVLGPRNAGLVFGPQNAVWAELPATAAAGGFPSELPERWSKPLAFARGDARGLRLSDAGSAATLRLQDPSDFAPFAVPFASPGPPLPPSGLPKDLPPAFEEAWKGRLQAYQRLLDQLQSLPEEDRVFVQTELKEAFLGKLAATGEDKELEHLRLLESKRGSSMRKHKTP